MLDVLMNISPIDGRYKAQVRDLEGYFSEFALFKYRLFVEVEYFISLTEIPLPQLQQFDHNKRSDHRNIYKKFTPESCLRIKEIEKTINHDVKAVEYYIKEHFDQLGLEAYKEFIHFWTDQSGHQQYRCSYQLPAMPCWMYMRLCWKI